MCQKFKHIHEGKSNRSTYDSSCTSKGHDFHEGSGKLVEAVKGIRVGRASKA